MRGFWESRLALSLNSATSQADGQFKTEGMLTDIYQVL